MENLNFTEKNVENYEEDEQQQTLEKETKIIFDYDQLDYIRFKLKFEDGFNFGLGLIVAIIIVNLFIFLILMILGLSFSGFISKIFLNLLLKV